VELALQQTVCLVDTIIHDEIASRRPDNLQGQCTGNELRLLSSRYLIIKLLVNCFAITKIFFIAMLMVIQNCGC
jgi:hypothetical protein